MWLAVILYSWFLVSRSRGVWEGLFGCCFSCLRQIRLSWSRKAPFCERAWKYRGRCLSCCDALPTEAQCIVKRCCQTHPMFLHRKQTQGCFVKLVHRWEDEDRCWCPVSPRGWKPRLEFTACWNLHAVKSALLVCIAPSLDVVRAVL